jgi:5-methylcytosine-specific restriction endonuclease McrA
MNALQLNEPVLVLNINYEPLHVCNIKRALSLIFAEKAEIIHNGRGQIHTSSQSFDLPSIIRLNYMIKRPRPRVNLNKREILRRDDFTCQYCGRKNHTLTIDHVVPRRLGGGFSWKNLVAACGPCNRRKGGRTPVQANMSLRSRPAEPPASALYRFGRYLQRQEDWQPFVQGW